MSQKKEQNFLIRLLGLLRPLDIAKMTKDSSGVKKVRLTELMVHGDKLFVEAKEQSTLKEKKVVEATHLVVVQETKENVSSPAEAEVLEEDKLVANGAPVMSIQEAHEEEVILDKAKLHLTKEEDALSGIGIASGTETAERERLKKERENKKKRSSTQFILEEKEKLEASRNKLKGIEIREAYKKNAEVDLDAEKAIREDLSQSANTGILINKDQC